MAIIYPRHLPDGMLQECTFSLQDAVVGAAFDKGQSYNLSQVDDPTWKVVIETDRFQQVEAQAWSAWKKSLRGGLKTFVTHDRWRSNPLAYPDAGASTDISSGWNGTASVASLASAGALGLSALPANYKASAGDRVGLEEDGRYGYYEILEDVTASGAGSVALTVAPFLHTTVFTTAAVARLWRPVCQFIIDWRSWQEQGVADPTSVSFEAWQRL